jgi:hypothetical protein
VLGIFKLLFLLLKGNQNIEWNREEELPRGASLFGKVLIVIALLALWVGPYSTLSLRMNCVETESTVQRIFKKYEDRKNSLMQIEVSFKDPETGIQYHEESLDRDEEDKYSKGDKIQICYNPSRPARAMFKSELEESVIPGTFIICSMIIVGAGLIRWSWSKQK